MPPKPDDKTKKKYTKFNKPKNNFHEKESPKQDIAKKRDFVCYNCRKKGHTRKYCRLNKKINGLNIDEEILSQINNIMLEFKEETSSEFSIDEEENGLRINKIETSDPKSESSKKENFKINVLTNEEKTILHTIDQINEPEEKEKILHRFQSSNFPSQFDKTYNLTKILNRG